MLRPLRAAHPTPEPCSSFGPIPKGFRKAPTTWAMYYRGVGSTRPSYETARTSRSDPELDRRHEERDLRHRFGDPIVDGHGHRLAEGRDAPLEELVVV
jgi:hypothetical protein